MKYEIEFVQFTRIVVEAENREEAEDIASLMDGEDIAEHDPHEYIILNIAQLNKVMFRKWREIKWMK